MAIITLVDSCANYRRTIRVDEITTKDNWVFLAEGCLVLKTRLGADWYRKDTLRVVPADTIYWPPGDTVIVPGRIDTVMTLVNVPDTIVWDASNCGPCLAPRTFPLVCTDTIWTDVTVTVPYTTCDTLCYYPMTTARDSAWLELSEIAFAELLAYNGGLCDVSAPNTVCMWFDAGKGKWIINYQELTNPNYPHKACPIGSTCGPLAQQKCCIAIPTLYAWFAYQYGIYNLDPYVNHVEVNDSTRLYVPCAGNTSAQREIKNCVTVQRNETHRIPTVTTTDSGRDTTIMIDTCNVCLVPTFTCSAVIDSVRDTLITNVWAKKPIYDTTYDTIPCVRTYTVTTGIESTWHPPQSAHSPCWNHLPLSTVTCHPDWAPNRYPMTYDYIWYGSPNGDIYVNPCFTCDFDPETWTTPPGKQVCWIDGPEYQWFLTEIGCEEGYCTQVDVIEIKTGPCCAKDTTVIGYCLDGAGNVIDFTSVTSQTPDLDNPCEMDTIRMTITITGWLDSLVRIDTTYRTTPVPVSIRYDVVWTDTCMCSPTVNGKPFCDDMVITYCDVPLTWEGNVLKIPCSPADMMTDAQVASLVSFREMSAESQDIRAKTHRALRDTALVLRGLIGAGGGGEGGPELDPVYTAAAPGLVLRTDSTQFSHGFVTPRQMRDTLLFLWAQITNLKNTDIQLRDSLRKHTVRINQLVDTTAKLRHQIEILGDSIAAHRTVLNGLGGGGSPTNGLATWAATYELEPGGVNIAWISSEPQAVIVTYVGNADEPPGQPTRWEYEPGGGVWIHGEEGRYVSVVIYYWSY